MKAVVLAAGTGSRLAPLTDDRPKPLVPVAGRPLLFHLLERLAEVGIEGVDVIVVGGYRCGLLRQALADAGQRVTVVNNPRFADWGNFWSLFVAREAVEDSPFLQLDGDLLIDSSVLPRMLSAPGPAAVAVAVRPDLDEETMKVAVDPAGRIVAVSKHLRGDGVLGESVGIARFDSDVGSVVFEELRAMGQRGPLEEYYEYAYAQVARRGHGPFLPVDVSDCVVTEIDDATDLADAEALFAAGAGTLS